MKIISADVSAVCFPTSLKLDGSDPRHFVPDYSAAVLQVLTTEGLSGYSVTFTIGDGTQDMVSCIENTVRRLIGRTLEDFIEDPGALSEALIDHHQRRWLGQGGMHRMACGAVVNAMWDLWAKKEGKPLWKLLVDLPPEKLCQAIDFRHLRDGLNEEEALSILRSASAAEKTQREKTLRDEGLRLYLTKGWSGTKLEEIQQGCENLLQQGCTAFKAKVGRNFDYGADNKVLAAMREVIGPDSVLFVDSNQNLGDWQFAAEYMSKLSAHGLFAIEEPIASDDVLGYIELRKALKPYGIEVAGGEHVPTPVIFKQLLVGGGLGLCQIDACRHGGVGDVLAAILMAKKYDVPVWPHGGGIGLCHLIRHYSIWDQIVVAGDKGQRTEYIDFLQGPEVFEAPLELTKGHYAVPTRAGWGVELKDSFHRAYLWPYGRSIPSFENSDRLALQVGGQRYQRWWKGE